MTRDRDGILLPWPEKGCFIFPDEAEYEEQVLNGIKLPVDVVVKLRDAKTGKVIDVDNQ